MGNSAAASKNNFRVALSRDIQEQETFSRVCKQASRALLDRRLWNDREWGEDLRRHLLGNAGDATGAAPYFV